MPIGLGVTVTAVPVDHKLAAHLDRNLLHSMLHTWKSFLELHLNYRHDLCQYAMCILKFDIDFYHFLITRVAFMSIMKWSLAAIPVLFRNILCFALRFFSPRKLNIENFRHIAL